MMTLFNESATSSRVGLQVSRDVINIKIQNHPILKIKIQPVIIANVIAQTFTNL